MTQIRENIKKIFSGFYLSATDHNQNLWIFEPEGKLYKGAACVKAACVTQNYCIALFGVERVGFERFKKISTLFEVAEEKAMDIVVKII